MGATPAIAPSTFTYVDIPASDVKALEGHARAVLSIQDRQRKLTAENVLKLGKELKAAQERLSNHGNGTFGKWCKERCGISPQHALRCISTTTEFGGQRFEQIVQNFDASALYLLSSDTCPEDALSDALEAAKSGEVVTHKRAKEIIANYTVDADGSNGEADGSESYCSLLEGLEAVNKAITKILGRWPKDEIETLGAKLSVIGKQITETGGFEC